MAVDLPAEEHARWIAQVQEEALEPELPICDAHHHIWNDAGHTGSPYTLADFHADTGSGHNVVCSVFAECHTEYRKDGPEHLRPVGETEFVAELAQQSVDSGKTEITAIVASADVSRGDAVEEVLSAHDEAGRGLFRGVRYVTAQDAHPPLAMASSVPMDDPGYLAGVRRVGAMGFTYDAMVYHPQLRDLAKVVKACPDTFIVIGHLGLLLGTGPYKCQREESLVFWRGAMKELASYPNTYLKVGGIGLPLMGFRWDKQERPPTSEELAKPWAEPIQYVIEQFGPHRCMFETNTPVDKRGAGYVVLWNAFKRIVSDYTVDEKRYLFHDAAAHAYRFKTIG